MRAFWRTWGTQTLEAAQSARYKPRLIFQLLIFLVVFGCANVITTMICTIPTVIWAVQEAIGGDVDDAMQLVTRMPSWLTLVMLAGAGAQTVAAIFYCRLIEQRPLRSMGFRRDGWLRRYLIGFAVGAGLLLAAAGICVLGGAMQFSRAAQPSVGYVLLFLLGFVIQGMGEEVMMRGYVLVSLTSRVPKAAAVGISAVLFGLLHLSNQGMGLLPLCNLILFGVLAGVYFLRFDDIWGICGVHSAWNFVQGNVLGIQVSGIADLPTLMTASTTSSGALLHGGAFGLEGGLAVTGVMTLSIAALVLIPGRRQGR